MYTTKDNYVLDIPGVNGLTNIKGVDEEKVLEKNVEGLKNQ